MELEVTECMINLLDMNQPLRDVIQRVPQVLLNELLSDERGAMLFCIRYQLPNRSHCSPVYGGDLGTWVRQLRKVLSLEKLRRTGNWAVHAYPKDLQDVTFWGQIQVQGTTVSLKPQAA